MYFNDAEPDNGYIVLSYDITGDWQQIAYYDDLKEAYIFALNTLKEYNNIKINDTNFCKSVTVKDLHWFDQWNFCKQSFKGIEL